MCQVDNHHKKGLPLCPRGSVLMATDEGDGVKFLEAAENNKTHYGKFGLKTFMAAHNDNCRKSPNFFTIPRNSINYFSIPWAFQEWSEYEKYLERLEI